ncbi:unnamed protein product [Moneuplotes crassus]|uniref:Ubiquitin-activating enzyme E1 n=3 Tax=Euplotes crassus TaxID=5936 RepID=A0AAD2D096_EUPCR|nr:unnamed protein product [Moneuplotes crassus]
MDKKQKLRYSRQIKTYGRDMQQRLMQMKFFIYGARGLGVEAAKHLILNGVDAVHICDPTQAEARDFGSNYFLRKEKMTEGITRAEASLKQLKILNNGVEVKVIPELDLTEIIEGECKYNCVIVTEAYGLNWEEDSQDSLNIYNLNNLCRKHNISFILAEALGFYGYIFNDFGDEYRVQSTGIEEEQIAIKDMTYSPECVITTRAKCSEYFEEDDIVEFLNLEGSKGIHMLNEKEYQILELVGSNKIRINCDTSKYCDFRRGAKLSLKKRGETMTYLPLESSLSDPKISDVCGLKKHTFFAKLLLEFRKLAQKSDDICADDCQQMFELATSPTFRDIYSCEFGDKFDEEITLEVIQKFVRTLKSELITITSIIGGVIASEALKLTGKYTPIDQWFGYDQVKYLPIDVDTFEEDSRYYDYTVAFGKEVQENISTLNVFVPGAGAIGCEVLKCLACGGFGLADHDGKITLVDFDTLEISNLNRQFLYRDSDRRKSKAQVAKKRIKLINPELDIASHKIKVDLDTYSHAMSSEFWSKQDLCINALDNINGRVYLDVKCIEHEIPFYESGTEGQMAHTSVIIPFKTNTYTDYKIIAPKEQKKETIPFCTLRNEPHTISHCTEWALSKFNDHFVTGLRDIRIFLDTTLSQHDLTYGQVTSLVQSLQWMYDYGLEISLESCLKFALLEFTKYFHTEILIQKESNKGQKEKQIKEKMDFISIADPIPIEFDLESDDINPDKSPFEYVFCYAMIIFMEYGEGCQEFKIEELRPKAKELVQKMINTPKEEKKCYEDDDEEEEIITETQEEEIEDTSISIPKHDDVLLHADFIDRLVNLRETIKKDPRSFELIKKLGNQIVLDKDNEIMLGFVHSATCLRAANFGIPHDHLTPEMTQLECGKIIPAVSTTTGIITGFLLNELIKERIGISSNEDLHEYQVNLSVPSVMRNELESAKFRQNNVDLSSDFDFRIPKTPNPTENGTMNTEGFWNAWHKVPYDGTVTIRELYDYVVEEYKETPVMFQIFPNFVSIDNVQDNDRFDQPLLNEFLDVVNPYSDDYCVVHTAFDLEEADSKQICIPSFKLDLKKYCEAFPKE